MVIIVKWIITRLVLDYFDREKRIYYFQSKIQSSHTNKSKNGSLICVVCGSSAHGCNFGAIICESCKSLFRRNARKNPVSLK